MQPAAGKVFWLKGQRAEPGEAFRTRAGEVIQQLRERLALRLRFVSPAVEGIKRPRLAKLQDQPRAGNPVRMLTVDKMGDNLERRKRVLAFVSERPELRKIAKQRIQHGRGASKECNRVLKTRFHWDS